MSQIIEKYGMPKEVATAYREIEHRITPALAQPSYPDEPEETRKEKVKRPLLGRFFGIFADFRAWGAFLYLLFSLLTGIFYFTWAITGISLSAGLIVLIIGLPFYRAVHSLGLLSSPLPNMHAPGKYSKLKSTQTVWYHF